MEADRYRSRILREIKANRANPFNSPPSSTGSHGSASPTVSSVFSDPDGESTRRLHADIARVTAPRKLPVNWEAAHRKWPDFFSLPSKDGQSGAKAVDDASTCDLWPQTRAEMQPRVDNGSDLSSVPSPALRAAAARASRNHSPLSRVESRAESMAEHARAPSDSASREPRRRSSITEALDRLRRASLSPRGDGHGDGERRERSGESASPPLSSAKSSLTAVPPSPASLADADGHSTSLARSFLVPDVSHLGDFVTGTLKFSGSMKNGVPIFVKSGRVHDRRQRPSADSHADVDGIEVPQVEEKIFVSMDMIRDEIVTLQEHHDKVQEYAENLQQQVERLEAQLKAAKHPQQAKDSGHGEIRLVTRNQELELEVASLKARLETTQRKATDSEMENVSLAHERDRAVGRLQSACDDISKLTRKLSVKERELESSHKLLETTDQVRQDNDTLRRDLLSLKHGRKALERENESLRAENEALRGEVKQLREEIESLRADNNSLRRGDGSLLSENRSLRTSNKSLLEENEHLRESLDGAQHELDAEREQVERLQRRADAVSREKTTLEQDNDSLVRHNEKYFNENKMLRRENSGYERSAHELHEAMRKLRDEVDFLKQQPDHCRPLPTDEDLSARLDDETEENMTSAFFVPDITINTNESGPAEVTETGEMPAPPELTSQGHRMTTTTWREREQETRDESRRETQHTARGRAGSGMGVNNAAAKQATQQAQRVSFSVPDASEADGNDAADTDVVDGDAAVKNVASGTTASKSVADRKTASRKAVDKKTASKKVVDVTTASNTVADKKMASKMVADMKTASKNVADMKTASKDAADMYTASNKATDKNTANRGSKRRNPARRASAPAADLYHDGDDTTAPLSADTTQDQATVSLNLTPSARDEASRRAGLGVAAGQSRKPRQAGDPAGRAAQRPGVAETDAAAAGDGGTSCPALSGDARRILDGLCEHNCRNCIVCSRIASHRGVVTAAEAAAGKKRVAVARPVPVGEREPAAGDDATVRPSRAPGQALALVIKGLEDEARHLQLELARLQARYNGGDRAVGRRQRLAVAAAIRALLRRLELNGDHVYSLYDVLEGLRAAGQAMSEDEVEMTVLTATGMTLRDVAAACGDGRRAWSRHLGDDGGGDGVGDGGA